MGWISLTANSHSDSNSCLMISGMGEIVVEGSEAMTTMRFGRQKISQGWWDMTSYWRLGRDSGGLLAFGKVNGRVMCVMVKDGDADFAFGNRDWTGLRRCLLGVDGLVAVLDLFVTVC